MSDTGNLIGLHVASVRTRPITMLKIETLAEGKTTVVRLAGRINTQHLDELNKLIADAKPRVKLDLSEVTLVDINVVRFLGDQERPGVQLAKCSRYVREWIQREQATNSTSRERDGVEPDSAAGGRIDNETNYS